MESVQKNQLTGVGDGEKICACLDAIHGAGTGLWRDCRERPGSAGSSGDRFCYAFAHTGANLYWCGRGYSDLSGFS